jgi:uridine phosphorylase
MGLIAGDLPLGGLLVVTRAIGGTGAARLYGAAGGVDASPAVVAALAAAAAEAGVPAATGSVATTDSYYLGQGRALRPGEAPPAEAAGRLAAFAAAGALGCDMETETVFAVGRRLGLAVGAVLAVHGDRVSDRWLEDYEPAQERLLRVALAAARTLLRTLPPPPGETP